MSCHISNLCRTLNFHLRNLWRIRRFLSQEACHHAVRALILSRIDYANSLLYGARERDLKRLQRLQNKAARLVYACGRDRCSAELLSALHWLPVKERLNFKVMLHVYNCISGKAPAYLQNLVLLYNHPESARSRRRLRSSSDVTKLNTVRSFKKLGIVVSVCSVLCFGISSLCTSERRRLCLLLSVFLRLIYFLVRNFSSVFVHSFSCFGSLALCFL